MNQTPLPRVIALLCLVGVACKPAERDEPDPFGPGPQFGGSGGQGEPGAIAPMGRCGNGWVEGSETCDDGNLSDGDYCSADCNEETGSCGDGVLQSQEPCDAALDAQACDPTCKLKLGFACTREPFSCQPVSLAGLPDPAALIEDLGSAQREQLCAWVQREWRQHLPMSGYWFCGGSSFNDTYKVDLAQDSCDSLLGRVAQLATDYQRVVARCPITIGNFERCQYEIITAPCKHSSLATGIDASCFRGTCPLGAEGASCETAAQCQTQNCCPVGTGNEQVCSVRFCTYGKEGASCTGDAYCESKRCLRGVCIGANGLADGATCQANQECYSGSCMSGVCRGMAAADTTCTVNAECASNVCCAYRDRRSCAGPEGCTRVIGNYCGSDSDCLGFTCNRGSGAGYCTKSCTSDPECGMNAHGLKNWCMFSNTGQRCAPGCTSDSQCQSFGGCTTTQCRAMDFRCITFEDGIRACAR